MNILIKGVGPHNKGAELMLIAILEQLSSRLPRMRPVIAPGIGPYVWRSKLGLYQLFDAKRSGHLGWLRSQLFHQGYRDRFGLVLPEQIDAVLDASGYAFGDPWKIEHVDAAAREFERYRRFGARIILLPQAFGPFKNARIRAASTRILGAADLVFARDQESFAHCQALLPKHPGLHQAPDFTNLLQCSLPRQWIVEPKHVALVPNSKMVTQVERSTACNYVPAFAKAVRRVHAAGYRPFVLVHEQNDPILAAKIAEASEIECPVIVESDPLALKAILGCCAFTIGSRFHGLVSALSQGVPSIGTSWSHKYFYLFEDYGVPEWLCSIDDEGERLIHLVDKLCSEHERDKVISQLRKSANTFRYEAEQAWGVIAAALASSHDSIT
jgi:polysaccharide pyruvyl transferase WcaK-like protein